jgi:hypothetical protein
MARGRRRFGVVWTRSGRAQQQPSRLRAAAVALMSAPSSLSMISAESAESRPSRFRGRFASLDTVATARGMAATRRTGEKQATMARPVQVSSRSPCN